jgi:hypothetical protein
MLNRVAEAIHDAHKLFKLRTCFSSDKLSDKLGRIGAGHPTVEGTSLCTPFLLDAGHYVLYTALLVVDLDKGLRV